MAVASEQLQIVRLLADGTYMWREPLSAPGSGRSVLLLDLLTSDAVDATEFEVTDSGDWVATVAGIRYNVLTGVIPDTGRFVFIGVPAVPTVGLPPVEPPIPPIIDLKDYSDDFNRADGDPGSSWTLFTDGSAYLSIVTSELTATAAGEEQLGFWNLALPAGQVHHKVEVRIGSAVPSVTHLLVRGSESSGHVRARIHDTGVVEVLTCEGALIGSVLTPRADATGVGVAPGGLLSLEASESNYVVRVDGAEVLRWDDAGGAWPHVDDAHLNCGAGLNLASLKSRGRRARAGVGMAVDDFAITLVTPTVDVTADFTGGGALSAEALLPNEVRPKFTGDGALTATAAPPTEHPAKFSGIGRLLARVEPGVAPPTTPDPQFNGEGTLGVTYGFVTPKPPYSDDFNRPDGPPGDQWTVWHDAGGTDLVVRGNEMVSVSVSDEQHGWWNKPLPTPNHAVEITVGSDVAAEYFLLVRAAGTARIATTYVQVRMYTSDGSVELNSKDVDFTRRASLASGPSLVTGQVIRFEAKGTEYILLVDGVEILRWSDTAVAWPYVDDLHRNVDVAMQGVGSFDDFKATDLDADTTPPEPPETTFNAEFTGGGALSVTYGWGPPPFDPEPYHDDFERPDGTPGPGWTITDGDPTLLNGELYYDPSSGRSEVVWWNPLPEDDHGVEFIVGEHVSDEFGAILRLNGPGGSHVGMKYPAERTGGDVDIYTRLSSTAVEQTWRSLPNPPALVTGSKVTFTAVDKDYIVYFDDTEILRWTDAGAWHGANVGPDNREVALVISDSELGSIEEFWALGGEPPENQIDAEFTGDGALSAVAYSQYEYADDFNRPDGAPGDDWEIVSDAGNDVVVKNGELAVVGDDTLAYRYAIWLKPLPGNDHKIEVEVGTDIGSSYTLMVRSSNDDGHMEANFSDGSVSFLPFEGGLMTGGGTGAGSGVTPPMVTGAVLGFEAVGGNYIAYFDRVEVARWSGTWNHVDEQHRQVGVKIMSLPPIYGGTDLASIDDFRAASAEMKPFGDFDFHEGSGSTATSSDGEYVLTATDPATAWDGEAAAGQFVGVVGGGLLDDWSAEMTFTVNAYPTGGATPSFDDSGSTGALSKYLMIGYGGLLGINCDSGRPWGSTVVALGVPHTVVWGQRSAGLGKAGGTLEIYLDGVLELTCSTATGRDFAVAAKVNSGLDGTIDQITYRNTAPPIPPPPEIAAAFTGEGTLKANEETHPAEFSGKGELTAEIREYGLYEDNFNRADGPAGDDWIMENASEDKQLSISNNMLVPTSNYMSFGTWVRPLPSRDMRVEATIGSMGNSQAGFIIRARIGLGDTGEVEADFWPNGVCYINTLEGNKAQGGSRVRRAMYDPNDPLVPNVVGMVVAIECVGKTYTAYRDDVVMCTWTDANDEWDHIDDDHLNAGVQMASQGGINSWRASPMELDPDPVAHFDFHEGSGTTAASTVGDGALTATNAATAWDGERANGHFRGPAVPGLVCSEWTVALHMVLNSVGPNGPTILENTFSADGSASHSSIGFDEVDGQAYPGFWTPEAIWEYSPTALTVGVPHTLALVGDMNEAGTVTLYVDGVVAVSVGSQTQAVRYLDNVEILGTAFPQDAIVDNLTYWERALTPEEVAALPPPDPAQPRDVPANFSGGGTLTGGDQPPPEPISNFDFHECGGSVAASTIGAYTLVPIDPVTCWDDRAACNEFAGVVGSGVQANWSEAIAITINSAGATLHGQIDDFNTGLPNRYCVGVELREGIIVPGIFATGADWTWGTTPLTVGQQHLIVVTGGDGNLLVYVDGVLGLTYPVADASRDFDIPIELIDTGYVIDESVNNLTYWDVTLTPEQVAGLPLPPIDVPYDLYRDDFDRADGAPGDQWVVEKYGGDDTSTCTIVDGELRHHGLGGHHARWARPLAVDDHKVEVVLGNLLPQTIELHVRLNPDDTANYGQPRLRGSFYTTPIPNMEEYSGPGIIFDNAHKVPQGTFQPLSPGTKLCMEAVGTDYVLKIDDVEVNRWSDTGVEAPVGPANRSVEVLLNAGYDMDLAEVRDSSMDDFAAYDMSWPYPPPDEPVHTETPEAHPDFTSEGSLSAEVDIPDYLYGDDFDRPDGPPGDDWTLSHSTGTGDLVIANGALVVGEINTYEYGYWNRPLPGVDHKVEVVLNDPPPYNIGLAVRASLAAGCVRAGFLETGEVSITSVTGAMAENDGLLSHGNSSGHPFVGGTTLSFEAIGPYYTARVNGAVAAVWHDDANEWPYVDSAHVNTGLWLSSGLPEGGVDPYRAVDLTGVAPPDIPPPLYADDFDRPDGPPGADWTLFGGSIPLEIVGNQLVATLLGTYQWGHWNSPLPTPDHKVEVTVGTVVPNLIELNVRSSLDNGRTYVEFWSVTGQCIIHTRNGDYSLMVGSSVRAESAAGAFAMTPGTKLSFEAIGRYYIASVDGVEVLRWHDGDGVWTDQHTNKNVAVTINSQEFIAGMDNFKATDLSGQPEPLP